MLRLTLLAAVSCLVGFEDPASPPDPKASYEQRKADGRPRRRLSRLAPALLVRGRMGGSETRLRRLAVAVLARPIEYDVARSLSSASWNATAQWRRPEAVADAVKADPARADLLAEYAGRRVRTPVKRAQTPVEIGGLKCERRSS